MSNLIAITMCYDADDLITPGAEYNFVRREYGESVKAAGGEPIYVDPSIDPSVVARMVQGVIISGGQDIDPVFYGQENTHCGQLEPRARTEWERRLIDACDENDVPILGICYGSQLLNVHYGGTLYQDIALEQGSHADHGTSLKAAVHNVTFTDEILGYERSQVLPSTARHHQAVHELAPGFSAVGLADDGVIEAIKGHGHFGIQWHPESDATAAMIYTQFVEHCHLAAQPTLTSHVLSPLQEAVI